MTRPMAHGKIIPRSDLTPIVEGTAFADRARMMMHQAESEAHDLFNRAREEGFAEGLAMGRREGFSALAGCVDEVRAQLSTIEGELGALVMTLLQKIIGEMDERDLIRRVIGTAIADATDATQLVVRVPECDALAVFEEVEAVEAGQEPRRIREVVVDPLLRPGEIVIETPRGRAHVGVRQQLARVGLTLAE